MNFNKHFDLEGRHAFLSASNYHWINYSDEKLKQSYVNAKAKELGTRTHNLASELIELGIRQGNETTLGLYVDDAIGFKMASEQVLYYSPNCFGTADAISFKKDVLRIHDLKTGKTKASFKQLEIYAALFCLEYRVNPADIEIILGIYQYDKALFYTPDPKEIIRIMDQITKKDKLLVAMKVEG